MRNVSIESTEKPALAQIMCRRKCFANCFARAHLWRNNFSFKVTPFPASVYALLSHSNRGKILFTYYHPTFVCDWVILRPIPSNGIQISKELLVRMKLFCVAVSMMIKMMPSMISDSSKQPTKSSEYPWLWTSGMALSQHPSHQNIVNGPSKSRLDRSPE